LLYSLGFNELGSWTTVLARHRLDVMRIMAIDATWMEYHISPTSIAMGFARQLLPFLEVPAWAALPAQQLHYLRASSDLPEALCWMPNLAVLSLQADTFPKTVIKVASKLRVLILSCPSLHVLPASVGRLQALEELHLSDCGNLYRLPANLWQLPALQILHLDRSSICTLPRDLGQLSQLRGLSLATCTALAALPHSLGDLTRLEYLDLFQCHGLKALPQSFGQLSALRDLRLSCCSRLTALPDSLGQLPALRQLSLSGCSRLRALPDNLAGLVSLQHLDLSGCASLTTLPDSLRELAALWEVDLTGCVSLQGLRIELWIMYNRSPHFDTDWFSKLRGS